MKRKDIKKQVTELLSNNVKQICNMVVEGGLNSLEVKFEFDGKKYHLALIENGMVDNKKFELYYN